MSEKLFLADSLFNIGCIDAEEHARLIALHKQSFGTMMATASIKATPLEDAQSGIKNALEFSNLALKSGALDDHSIELMDQAEAIMCVVLGNLEKQELPPEFGYHMANAVNELQACTKLCGGKLQASVFDLASAVEKLRGEHE